MLLPDGKTGITQHLSSYKYGEVCNNQGVAEEKDGRKMQKQADLMAVALQSVPDNPGG